MCSQCVSQYVSLLAAALLFLFLSSPLYAATINLQLSQNPVQAGDSLQLRFTTNGTLSGEPDWSPLQQHFDISGRSVSQSVSIVNGARSDTKTWTLTVFPREAGDITIPPINFGQDQSQVMILKVVDNLPQTTGAAGNDVFVEMKVLTKQPYVQQQTIIVQRLFHTGSLSNAQLTMPEVEQGTADILQLGKNRTVVEQRNGRSYQVVERRYAVFPQSSGMLKIGRTIFDGVLTSGAQHNDPFGMRGKRLRRYSQPFTIEVQPQPAAVTADTWLPAKDVTLNAHWQTPVDKLQVGEPVTLTLAIVADGLTAQQLPAIKLQTPVGIKAYTDEPELRNEPSASGMVGVRQEKWVLVGANNGEFILPEVTLSWWNTKTKKEETARVAETTLVISGGAAVKPKAAENKPVPAENQALLSPDLEKPLPLAKAQEAGAAGLSTWVWGMLLAILVGVIGVVFWLRMRVQNKRQINASAMGGDVANGVDYWQLLAAACEQQSPEVVQSALLDWIKYDAQLPPPYLSHLREQAQSADLNQALDTLNSAVYSGDGVKWNGAALLKALQTFQNKTPEAVTKNVLPALYPD